MNTNPFPDRLPGDVDLVNEITNLLSQAGHPAPSNWENQLAMANPRTLGPNLQRFIINRYWRVKLGICEQNSTMERFCLIDSGEYKDYLEIFKVNVIPFIIKNNLGM